MPYNFDKAIQSGLSQEQITEYLSSQGREQEASAYFNQSSESFFDKIVSSGQGRLQNAFESVESFSRGEQKFGNTALQVAGQVTGFGGDIIGETIIEATPDFIKQYGVEGLEAFSKTKPGKAVFSAIGKGADAYNKWKEENPMEARDAEAILNIGAFALDVVGAKALLGVGKPTISTARTVAGNVPPPGGGSGGSIASRAISTVAETAPVRAGVAVSQGGTRIVTNTTKRGINAAQEALQRQARLRALPKPEANALRAGLDDTVAEFIKTSFKGDRSAYRRMIDLAKDAGKTLRAKVQPKQIPGETMLRYVTHVSDKMKSIGRELGDVVKGIPNQIVGIGQIQDDFVKMLDEIGVLVGDKGRLINSGTVPSGDMRIYQVMYDMVKSGEATPRFLHQARQRLFRELDLAGARLEPFSDQVDDVAEAFRKLLAGPVDDLADGKYLDLSSQYAQLAGPMRNFVKLIGYKGSLENIGSQTLRTAEVIQRVLGNAASRPQQVIDDIIEAATKAGLKIEENLADQIRFSDLIEDFFGTTQTRSLRGQVGRAGVDAAEELAETLFTQGPTGAGLRVIRGILGTTKAEQQKALEAFIDSLI